MKCFTLVRRVGGTALVLGVALLTHPALAQPGHEAAAEHAAGTHEVPKAGVMPTVEQGIAPMVISLVVFGLVLAVLSAKVWPKIAQGLKEREEKIRTAIEEAELSRQQAKDALEQYQKSLESARAEAQKMLEQTRQQQQALAADLKAKADAELAAMREKARKDIDAAKRAAVVELHAEAANLATMIAGKVLRRNITANDTNGLVEESLRELTGARG